MDSWEENLFNHIQIQWEATPLPFCPLGKDEESSKPGHEATCQEVFHVQAFHVQAMFSWKPSMRACDTPTSFLIWSYRKKHTQGKSLPNVIG